MALIKCPECGGNVSDKSPACIHCGYPLHNLISATEDYQIELISYGTYKLPTLTKIVEHTSKGLPEAQKMIDNIPCIIISGISKEKAEIIYNDFKYAGAQVQINKGSYSHTVLDSEIRLTCPKCKSTNITTGARGYNLFSGFIGSNKTVNRCGKCGYSWQPKK